MQTDAVLSNGQTLSNGTGNGHGYRRKRLNKLAQVDMDIIRLIGQHLRELGFSDTFECLNEEAGFDLEDPKTSRFRSCVLLGNWQEANTALEELTPILSDPAHLERMQLLMLKEKYLELLEEGKTMDALKCLRCEIAPLKLHPSDKDVQLLASYMMYGTVEELYKATGWPGSCHGARERLVDQLQAFLPATVMLPPMRLRQLLVQACQLQIDRCPFHYMDQDTSAYSLLTDHMCSRKQFPSEPIHVLADHADEVWYLKFSHSGTRLVSGARDGQIIIWNISDYEPVKERQFKGQNDGIAVVAWSPDDSMLLCCGREDCSEALVFWAETGELKCRIHNSSEESLTCCAWHHGGHKFYVGGTRGQFFECSLEGSVVASWEGVRLHAIATHPSTDLVYAADTHNRIRWYNFRDKTSTTLVQEDNPIMSFTLSKSGRHALLNITGQGVHVWDLQDRCLLQRYQGTQQGVYTIHSTYGGINDIFIASGSEDNHVYVWHWKREMPVVVLKGHTRPVNCVAWTQDIIASASDDGTVRLWGSEERLKIQKDREKQQLLVEDESVKPCETNSLNMVTQHIDIDQSSEFEVAEGSSSSSLSSSGQLEDGTDDNPRMEVSTDPLLDGQQASAILSVASESTQQIEPTQETGSSITTTV